MSATETIFHEELITWSVMEFWSIVKVGWTVASKTCLAYQQSYRHHLSYHLMTANFMRYRGQMKYSSSVELCWLAWCASTRIDKRDHHLKLNPTVLLQVAYEDHLCSEISAVNYQKTWLLQSSWWQHQGYGRFLEL